MLILDAIWKVDGRHALEDGIRRCWRKADILPIGMNTDINADIGRASTPQADKTISKEDCDQLCGLMKSLNVKALA